MARSKKRSKFRKFLSKWRKATKRRSKRRSKFRKKISKWSTAAKKRVKGFLDKQSAVIYFKGLKYPDAIRLGAVLLSCIAMCLLISSISTEYWVKKFDRGSFIFRGLWVECQAGKCTLRKELPFYVILALIAMLMSAWTCFSSVIFGTLSLTPSAKTFYPHITISLSFISGFSGGVGLFTFMRFSTNEPNTFFAWSLIPGWLSIILVSMAGVCHYVARRYEDEEAATALTTTVLFTLWEEGDDDYD